MKEVLDNEIKSLKAQIRDLEIVLQVKHKEKEAIDTECNQAKQNLKQLKDRLLKLEDVKDYQISEHAIIRYIERVCGVDIEAIKNNILSEEMVKNIEKFKSGKFPIKNGFVAVVKDYKIVTIE